MIIFVKIAPMQMLLPCIISFFRAQAVEEALRKDRDCPAEKETPKKGKGRGQASEKIRSPLHLAWICFSFFSFISSFFE
jgi:hypothetical protein